MAADSTNATTGAPEFDGAGAPDTAVDLTLLGAFAATVGTRLIGTTAARTAYAYAREGLEWYDTDLDAVYLHNGSGWVLWHKQWTSYTPTTANVSGSPTITAKYCVASGMVRVKIHMLLAGANVGTGPTFSLPVTAATLLGSALIGPAVLRDNGTDYTEASVYLASTTTVTPVVSNVGGTYPKTLNSVTATVPFTWASGDWMNLDFTYEAA